jgi:hypothetical protein
MRFKVITDMEVQTSKGSTTLKEGQVIKLSKEEAIPLINEKKIKPFCYWLKSVVDDCQMPCFEIDAKIVNHECPHFKTYWAKRLSELQNTGGQP